MKKDVSNLLVLLNERAVWKNPPAIPPVLNEARTRAAIQCVQEVENSDPFAGARAALYLRQGYEYASDVLKDCNARRKARLNEALNTPQMQGLKKRLDTNWAWNRHKADAYRRPAA